MKLIFGSSMCLHDYFLLTLRTCSDSKQTERIYGVCDSSSLLSSSKAPDLNFKDTFSLRYVIDVTIRVALWLTHVDCQILTTAVAVNGVVFLDLTLVLQYAIGSQS